MAGLFSNLFKKKADTRNLSALSGMHEESSAHQEPNPPANLSPWGKTEQVNQRSPTPASIQESNTDLGLPPQQRRFDVPDVTVPDRYGSVKQETITQDVGVQVSAHDIQLILSKLDLINSRVENINKRFEAIEATNKVERKIW